LKTRFVSVFVGLIAVAIALIGVASASAAEHKTEPPITLKKNAPETALLGSKQTVTLVAANPKETKRGYNLSFRDVLPTGVKFLGVKGEGEAPKVIPNAPSAGKTTLLFENVADLSSNSSYTLTYEIEAEESAYTVGGHFKNEAEAFVSRAARNKPTFNANGEVETASYTGSAEASAETKLSAIEITKSEPNPEHELLRGVHEHQTVYTLVVQNNQLKPTKEISVEDFLPPGLEYLACDEADNTTNASATNPGSKEEYVGAGPINAEANIPPAKSREHCRKPTEVETGEFDPPGPKPKGLYTHVVWTGLGELKAGEKLEVQYIAAVPIRQNALFAPGTAPTAKSLGQAANLDNNTGPETVDEEELTNVAGANGTFVGGPSKAQEIPVSAATEHTVTAEDLAIQKSVDKPTIAEGQISTWTLKLETSEYRYVNNIKVEDTTPNGICPLGKKNYEAAPQETAAGSPCLTSSERPSAEYTNVEEQANGTFKILWDQTTDPALAQMKPSETTTITFPTKTRTYYQKNFENSLSEPILTRDSWTNQVDTVGENFARCAPNDPTCTKGQPKISTTEAEGTAVRDHSEASQEAGGVTIDKKVRENVFGQAVPSDCEEGTYVDGLTSPLPKYRPGDYVCWQVRVNFAPDLYAGTPAVTDFLPADEKYVTGSAHETVNNTVTSTFNTEEAAFGSLEWTLGSSVASGNKVFEWRFLTEMQKPSTEPKPGEITGNLMKFTYSNHAGTTFPLRDRAEIERAEPKLKLVKTVASVGGSTAHVNGEGNATEAKGGEAVKYNVAVQNTGNLEAKEIEVWDRLPTNNITCASVKSGSISNGGKCETVEGKPVIKWTGVTVAAGTSSTPTTTNLTYEVTLPSNVAPAQTYNNEAGVTQYASETNKEVSPGKIESFHYYPSGNIAGTTFEGEHAPNAGPLKDPAQVKTAAVKFTKAGTAPFEQGGNNNTTQATIGEKIKYVITTTVPAGSQLYGSPEVTDTLGTRLALVPKSVKGFVNGVETPTAGVEVGPAEGTGNPFLKFPATYTNAPASEDDVVKLEFEATVTDVAANGREVGEGKLVNEAKLTYNDQNGTAVKTPNATATNQIVEPLISVAKTNNAPGGVVEPGKKYEYTVTASNAANTATVKRVSTANDTLVEDVVPNGMTPVNGSTPVENNGTVEPNGGVWNESTRTITWTVTELAPGASKALSYFVRIEPTNAGSTYKNTVLAKTTSLPGAVSGERTTASLSHAGYEATAENTVKLVEAGLTKAVAAPKGESIGDPLDYTLTFKLKPQVKYFDTTVEDQLPKGVAPLGKATIKCAPGCEPVAAAATELSSKSASNQTTLAWYFGAIAESSVERTITIEYVGYIAQELEPGVKTAKGATLTNHAIGLYNGEAKFTKPPTTPPAQGEFSNKTTEPSTTSTVTEPHLVIRKKVAGNSATGIVQPGDPLTYTIEVENTGNSNAYDAVVEDNNPSPTGALGTPITAGGKGEAFLKPEAGKPLRWVITGPIEPGAAHIVELTYKETTKPTAEVENGQEADNTVHIPDYFGAPEAQRNAEKLEGVERFRDYKENPSATVILEVALPQVALKKSTGPNGTKSEKAFIGEEFEWRLEAKNSSTVATLKGLDLTDVLPAGWKYVSGSSVLEPGGTHPTPTATHTAAGEEETLVWENVGDLGPNGVIKLNFKAIPTTELIGNEEVFVNHATAKGEDKGGSSTFKKEGSVVPYEAADTAEASLLTPPLTIEKTPKLGEPASRAVAGEPASYTLAITNGGSATATEVEVQDLLDLGQKYTPGSATSSTEATIKFEEVGTPTVETIGGKEKLHVAWKIASIAPESTTTITVPVELPASTEEGKELEDIASAVSRQQPSPTSSTGGLKVEREADLRILKTGPRGELTPGETAVYNLEVENEGPSNAKAVVIHDKLPAGTKFITADSPCHVVGEEIICELGELEPGASHKREFEITLEVLSSTTGPVVNEAEVDSPTPDPEPTNNKSKVENETKPKDSLSVVKKGPEQPVLLGSTFEYELEVTNAGPSDAANVKVTDHLPAQEEFASAEAPCVQSTTEAAVIECPIASIPAGAPAVKLHFKVKAIGSVPAGGEKVTNVATVTSETENINLNNTGEAETEVLPAADLSVVKTAPATVEPNGELTYTLHVENHGPSVAHEVKVTDPLPAGVEFKSASEGCTFAAGVVTCAVQAPEGELGFEEEEVHSVDFQVTVHVPFALGGKPLTNTATVKGKEADPVTENDSSTVTTTVGPAADLSIVKTMGKAQAGQPLTYTLAITNKGPSASSAVTVKDVLPVGTTFKSAAPSQGGCAAAGQEVTCNLGPLASGGSAQVSITVEVGATVTGNLRNVAKVEGPEPDPDKTNNESAVEGPVAPAPPSAPNLKVTKTVDTSTPQVGTPFDYHVTVSNMSGAEAKNVKVLDTLNGPVKVLSVETDSGKCEANGSTITCKIPKIPVGKTVHITYSVVAEEAGPLSNTASAQASNGEKAPANNHAVKGVNAKSGKANFTLTKTAAKRVVEGGKTVGFTITLRNGPVALVNATICDRLPAALVFVRAAGAKFVHGEACWQKKYVAAKQTVRMHLTARAVRGFKPRKARNVASASAENAPGTKHAAVTVHIKPAFAGAPGGVTG
jgi:large repetitive protein